MVDLNGHEAGNGGYSQRTPTAHRVSSTRRAVEAVKKWVTLFEVGPDATLARGTLVAAKRAPGTWRPRMANGVSRRSHD
jgi:hypothetical protein